MSCREYRGDLMELARGEALSSATRQYVMVHVERCAECARFLDHQFAVSAGLKSLAAEKIPNAAEFESRVMTAFDRASTSSRRPRIANWILAGCAVAAILTIAIFTRRPLPVPRSKPEVARTEPAAVVVAVVTPAPAARAKHRPTMQRHDEPPFLTIPYTVPLAPEERATVSRMSIYVSGLIAAGFNVQVSDPGAQVEADVLVSQDGRARAIRSPSISMSN
jgi:hypothetical protein